MIYQTNLRIPMIHSITDSQINQRRFCYCCVCSDLCEDEEFRNHLLELKHKHDIIMKSQLKHKTSLCRRTSSTGSRGYVPTPAGHPVTAQTCTILTILIPAGCLQKSQDTHVTKTILTSAGRSHALHTNNPYSSMSCLSAI